MKKALAMILALAMVFALAACGQQAAPAPAAAPAESAPAAAAPAEPAEPAAESGYTIGLAMISTSDEIFTRIIQDCQKIADEKGYNLLISDANMDAATQLTAIENFITSGCDAIIVQAVDANAIHGALQKAKAAGIKIVALFIPLNDGDWDAWYHNDEHAIGYGIGKMCGEWLNENFEGKGNVGLFEYPMIPTLITRAQGIRDGLAETAPDAVITVTAEGATAADGLDRGNAMLTSDPDLVAMCAIVDTPLLGAYQAVTIAGKDPASFGLFGSDGDLVALAYIAEGTYYKGTQAMNTTDFGPTAMQMAIDLLDGKDVSEEFTIAIPVTVDNVAEFAG